MNNTYDFFYRLENNMLTISSLSDYTSLGSKYGWDCLNTDQRASLVSIGESHKRKVRNPFPPNNFYHGNTLVRMEPQLPSPNIDELTQSEISTINEVARKVNNQTFTQHYGKEMWIVNLINEIITIHLAKKEATELRFQQAQKQQEQEEQRFQEAQQQQALEDAKKEKARIEQEHRVLEEQQRKETKNLINTSIEDVKIELQLITEMIEEIRNTNPDYENSSRIAGSKTIKEERDFYESSILINNIDNADLKSLVNIRTNLTNIQTGTKALKTDVTKKVNELKENYKKNAEVLIDEVTEIFTSIENTLMEISFIDPVYNTMDNKAIKDKHSLDLRAKERESNSATLKRLVEINNEIETIKKDTGLLEIEFNAKLDALKDIKKTEITIIIQDVVRPISALMALLDEINNGDASFTAAKKIEVSDIEVDVNAKKLELSVANLPKLITIKGDVENSKVKMMALEQEISNKLAQLKDVEKQEIEQLILDIEKVSCSLQQDLDEINISDNAYVQSKQAQKDQCLSDLPTIKNQYLADTLANLLLNKAELTDTKAKLGKLCQEVQQQLATKKASKKSDIIDLLYKAKENFSDIDQMIDKMNNLNFSTQEKTLDIISREITAVIHSFDNDITQRGAIESTLARENELDTADLNQLMGIYTEISDAKDITDNLKEKAKIKLKANFIFEAKYLRNIEEFLSAHNMLDLANKIVINQDLDFDKKITEVRTSIKEAMENKTVKKIQSNLASNHDLQWLLTKMQNPSSLKDKVKSKTGIDIDELNDLLAKHFDKVIKAENREVILFIGLTGSGKSTTINYLLGRSLKEEMTPSGETYIVPIQVNNSGNFPAIGTTTQAETLFPAVYQAPSENFSYADFPGFMDNRGEVAKVGTHIFSQIAINAATHIKEIVVVIECDSLYTQRAAGLRNLAVILGELLKYPKQIANSIRFIITKPNGKNLNHIKFKISSLYTELKNALNVENELAILELMYQASQNPNDDRITFINPVDNGESKDQLIMQFNRTSVGIRKEDFNSVPADTYSKLGEILTLVNEQKNNMEQIISLSSMVNSYKVWIATLEPQIIVSSAAKNLLVNLKNQVISMENFIGQTQREFNKNQGILQIFEKITALMGFSSATNTTMQAPLPNSVQQPGQPLGNIAPVTNTQITQPQQMQQPPPPYSPPQQRWAPQN